VALDVGCGCGGTAAWLAGKGVQVDGVSWNSDELKQASQHCRATMQCDLNDGLSNVKSDAYDLIVCSHILEHIAYPQKLLTDIRRALKPDGAVVVAIPNLLFWRDRLKLLCGNWEYQASGTFDYTHLRWYTRESMIKVMAEHGFQLECFIADGWIPLPGVRFFTGTKLRKRINEAIANQWPGLFGHQLLFRFGMIKAFPH
jgi:2-polyprenyl-3-methyl-5-hydroxy-6-metoxy-1,4-benzoquinol methylase